jgi:tetratricopeptide (TPR) repeat protein
MTRNGTNGRIDELLQRGDWEKARRLLQRERATAPDSHWVLTHLGVTFYEQGRYQEALDLFLRSRKIVPDCPLTLWNLAGALDALGKHAAAIRIYRGLLKSNKSFEDDPCWESKQWTQELKTDCVFRLGACFEHQGKKRAAEQSYRQYLDLLLLGMKGSYSLEDVTERIRRLHETDKRRQARSALRNAVNATLQAAALNR